LLTLFLIVYMAELRDQFIFVLAFVVDEREVAHDDSKFKLGMSIQDYVVIACKQSSIVLATWR